MKLYLAGIDAVRDFSALDEIDGVGILVSYWYLKNAKKWTAIEYAKSRQWEIFLDSGAFSAMTQGIKIDNREYMSFCKRHGNTFTLIAALDVIGDWELSRKNYDEALIHGIQTIPTFHVREPFSALKHFAQNSDYVALGVAKQQNKRRAVMAWLVECWRHLLGKCKVHGFALTSGKVMSSFPWDSVDSTTWATPLLRMRHVLVVCPNGTLKQIDRNSALRHRSMIDKYPCLGIITKSRLTTKDYDTLMVHNIKVLLEYMGRIEKPSWISG